MYRRRRNRRQYILRKLACWLPMVVVALMFVLGACSSKTVADVSTAYAVTSHNTEEVEETKAEEKPNQVFEDGIYTSKDEVALYIHTYNHLPSNYITKNEAEDKGWDSKSGNLDEVLPGMSIGGSKYGNYEGMLPKKDGRKYYECDIDYEGGYRGAKRIIYSNDGLIFYTNDHYSTFEQLY